MSGMPITIAGIKFPSREAAIDHCQKILYGDEVGTEVTGDDAQFLEAVLAARPDKVALIGSRRVVRYWRDIQPGPFTRTVCFYAELDDGERIDFSFHKAIDNIVAAQHPMPRSAA